MKDRGSKDRSDKSDSPELSLVFKKLNIYLCNPFYPVRFGERISEELAAFKSI